MPSLCGGGTRQTTAAYHVIYSEEQLLSYCWRSAFCSALAVVTIEQAGAFWKHPNSNAYLGDGLAMEPRKGSEISERMGHDT